jgi:hypothetical protein
MVNDQHSKGKKARLFCCLSILVSVSTFLSLSLSISRSRWLIPTQIAVLRFSVSAFPPLEKGKGRVPCLNPCASTYIQLHRGPFAGAE